MVGRCVANARAWVRLPLSAPVLWRFWVLFVVILLLTGCDNRVNERMFVSALCNDAVVDIQTFDTTDLSQTQIDVMASFLESRLCRTHNGVFHAAIATRDCADDLLAALREEQETTT